MKKILFSFMLFLMLSMLLVLPASAVQTSSDQQIALEIAALINEFRDNRGLYKLVYNTTLESTAQKHTEYQVSIEESTHYGEGNSRVKDRVTASGYGEGHNIFASEIIYHGMYATPQAAMEFWEDSQIHFGQMTSTQYHEFGVAVGRSETHIYFTVNFAAIQGVTSPGVGSAPVVPTSEISAPVNPLPENPDGSIVHSVEEGQTLQGIADAYQVSLDSLLLYNGLPPGSGLTVGQLILVKLPVAIIPTVELTQATPESTQPIETAEPTEEMVPTATQTEPATIEPTVEEPTGQGNNTLTIVVVAAVVIAAIAVFILLRLRKPIEEEDKDDGQVHDEKQEAHQIDSFHNRSRAQQIELLHEVAEMALEAYPLKVISIEPLRYVLNAEFLVKAGPEDREGDVQEFMMRVNAPGFHSKSEISAEMEWLTALHRETDLKVPFPLQTRTDEWVETVNLPAVGEPRHCVLFFNLPGLTTEMKATPDHMVFVGAVIARLHKHGASFQAPSGFSRKHWDLEGLKGGMLDVPANKAYGALTDDERKVVDAAEEVTAAAMENLGVNDQVYGLIHGDLHLKSFQYHEGQPQILDFDTCGYGYYIYDLSVAVWDLFDRDDFTSLKEGLLNGYRTERQLSEQEENLLMNFVAGRLMTQTLAWAGRRDDPHLGEAADSAIAKQVRQMGMLLQILAP